MLHIPHGVTPADIDERYLAGETPRAHAERLAREKAAKIGQPDAVVLAADTIVVVDGDVLGKPKDEEDAKSMLRRLSGRTHTVITAVAVAWNGHLESAVEEVEVTFHTLTEASIGGYIATGEPMDKAGAYGIQGYGATVVARVDGDYFAVMGLPLQLLVRVLERVGITYPFGPLEVL